jgi:RNA polymerase sigma factor (sigma-70 family)
MATVQTNPLLGYVRQLAASHLGELLDAQLLGRFVSRRDEAAFAALVRRHGPMVLGVCRRVLRDWHLAQDCFQLTFLVLARKADSLRRPDALGPFLYGVACRTARKAKAQAARRRQKESHVGAVETMQDGDETIWNDLRSVLDESVNSLPDKYRVPFVLHYLQGVTVSEVARRLNCPRGSVATRLLRARERLRARLVRRGVTLSAACLLAALSEASASVPSSLVALTARAASEARLSPVLVAPRIEGVFRVMRTTKGKIAAAGLLLMTFGGLSTGLFLHQTRAEDEKVQAPALAEARRANTPPKPRTRFLSLAEARAIALENCFAFHPPLHYPLGLEGFLGLEGLSQTPRHAASVRALADVTDKGRGIVLNGIPRTAPRAGLERNVNQMLLNVETAYWNLYGSYWQLYSREQGLRFTYEAWKIVGAKYKVGRVSLADFAQSEGQYNLFRSQRLQAIDTVLDNERQLRAILGLPTEDETRLVPSDSPSLVEMQPNWEKSLDMALKERPELRLAREDVEKAENNSPEHRRAILVLQDQELKTERFLGLYYRRLSSSYFQIKAARKQREAFATRLRERREHYEADKETATLDLILEAKRFWADALATEYQAIVTYNNSLAGWECAKGTIMGHAHVRLDYNPPTDENEVRAVVYEQVQTLTNVRRATAAPKSHGDAVCEQLSNAPSLPSLWKTVAPLKDVEELPKAESFDSKKSK